MKWTLAQVLKLTMVALGSVGCRAESQEPNPEFDRVDRLADATPERVSSDRRIEWSEDLARPIVALMLADSQREFGLAREAHHRLLGTQTQSPSDDRVSDVFRALVNELPRQLRPAAFRFQLTVLGDLPAPVFTTGGGYVYVQRHWLEQFFKSSDYSSDALAFALAHELGHICRGHTNRGRDFGPLGRAGEVAGGLFGSLKEGATEALANTGTQVVDRVYSEQQDLVADLFALHLCRNAGFDPARSLDFLRLGILGQEARGRISNRDVLLRRLKETRRELSGSVGESSYGLLEWRSSLQRLVRARDSRFRSRERCVVFVHGMESDLAAFTEWMRAMSVRPELSDVTLLGLRYPNDQSLARSAIFLGKEIDRTGAANCELSFVGHSAGGLVARYFRERLGGQAARIICLGTPQTGSDLASLRPLLEAAQVAKGMLSNGYPEALRRAILDGNGQITFDLQPGSLFLSHLNRSALDRSTYVIIRGRAETALALASASDAVGAGVGDLARGLAGGLGRLVAGLGGESERAALSLPEEITAGDLVVSLRRAALDDVTSVHTVTADHMELGSRPDVMARVIALLVR